MEGTELLSTIRQNPRTKEVPVVICSSSNDLDVIHKAIEMGCTDYILKPLNQKLIMKRVHDILEPEDSVQEIDSSGAHDQGSERPGLKKGL